MDDSEVPLLAHKIGRRLRELRDQAGRTAEDIAAAARSCGLGSWRRSTVAAIEAGERGVSVEEFIVLPLVLEVAGVGRPLLVDLLPDGDERVALAQDKKTKEIDATLTGAAVRAMFTGKPVDMGKDVDSPAIRQLSSLDFWSTAVKGLQAKAKIMKELWPESEGSAQRARQVEQDAAGSTEQKAARTLGLAGAEGAFQVAAASRGLWGRSLPEQRDALVAERTNGLERTPRTIQAFRGLVMRELLKELRERLQQRE